MEVILLERIEKLGQMGEMVNVRPGYARNFLLPQKKAISASEDSKAYFEGQRAQLEGRNLELKSEAEKLASKMDGLFVTMVRQAGDAGQLYGSVNARDIAVGATEAGFTTERRQVTLDVPIKTVGLHSVTVTLHPEVSVTVTANVARTADEAATQERTGEAVIKSDDDIGQSEPDLLAEALSEDETNNAADAVSDDVADAESGASDDGSEEADGEQPEEEKEDK